MNEDFATREWAENHGQLSDGIAKAARAIMESLKVLHEQQYGAPWAKAKPCRDSAKC
ncbi:MAG: hypothetical protein V4530_01715 [Pseudomonadota bacterium]